MKFSTVFERLFRWIKPTPDSAAGVPGKNPIEGEITVAFSNQTRCWNENFDLRDVLMDVLTEYGQSVEKTGDRGLSAGGYHLFPALDSLIPLDDGAGCRACTIIRFSHRDLGCQECFEWQHSVGTTLQAACRIGFEKWCKSDWVALLDATRRDPDTCTCLEIRHPDRALVQRYVLGPVEMFADPAADLELANAPGRDGHGFCTCCLTTACMDVLQPALEGHSFSGIRYFVMRDDDGTCSADCRINGMDFDPGKAILVELAKLWPGKGFQTRKQYVVVHDFSESAAAAGE